MKWRNGIQHCERESFGKVLVDHIMIKSGEDICHYNVSMWTSHLFLWLELQLTHTSRWTRGQKKNRNKKVWTSQPNTGDSKCFCALNVCICPTREQPKLAIIFRGKGKRLSAVEKASWDKDVDVYFQKNSWADTEFYLDWSRKTFKAIVKEIGNFILFLENQRSWGNTMVWCT